MEETFLTPAAAGYKPWLGTYLLQKAQYPGMYRPTREVGIKSRNDASPITFPIMSTIGYVGWLTVHQPIFKPDLSWTAPGLRNARNTSTKREQVSLSQVTH